MSDDAQMVKQVAAICEISTQIVDGRLGLIEGARKLSPLLVRLDDENPLFFPIIAFESSTDHLPVGEERRYWSAAALRDRDIDINRIESAARGKINLACKKIIEVFA